MKSLKLSSVVMAISLTATMTSVANAQEEAVCETAEQMKGNRLLRRLSLDLRGHSPSIAEITAQQGQDEIPAATIDDFMASSEFLQVVAKHHDQLVWPNLSETELIPDSHMLFPLPVENEEPIYLSILRSVFVRAGPQAQSIYLPCKNEPAEFDAEGRIIVEPIMMGTDILGYQEGWVEVEPYWAPGTTIRVCALDAQDNDVAVACPGPAERYPFLQPTCDSFDSFSAIVEAPFSGSSISCTGRTGILAPECGCGPNLRNCATDEVLEAITESLLNQQRRIVERVVSSDRPYHEILSDNVLEFNGPAAHYLTHHVGLSFDTNGGVDPAAVPPTIPVTQEGWTPVASTGRHSGLLTTPAFLLRFTTWRGRAHRFYNAFECSAFIPDGPLPSPFEPCSQHEDLTKRCGCDACHIGLEPLAAHWGRFSEYGFEYLDEEKYPTRAGALCTPPIASFDDLLLCFRQYELDPVGEETPFAGMLNGYVFRTPEQVVNIEQGPRKLVGESVASGRFTDCTVQRMWDQFMRRAPTAAEEAETLPRLEEEFVASNYNLRVLVKAIVSLPAYGRQR